MHLPHFLQKKKKSDKWGGGVGNCNGLVAFYQIIFPWIMDSVHVLWFVPLEARV